MSRRKRLNVDPKTVRRWLTGRVPYPGNRAALASLIKADEAGLWPEVAGPLIGRTRPEELARVYPHRWAIPRETWARFFSSAEQEISILAYSALFLAEDAGILNILADRARAGISVRIALGDPDSQQVAERGVEEGIGDAMPAKARNALALFLPLCPLLTSIYGFTRPPCTTRSFEPIVSFWSTSTAMESRLLKRPVPHHSDIKRRDG